MKTKRKSNRSRGLPTIVYEIRETFRSDNNNIIRRGDLLIEAKEMLEHGEWLPWLENNFDMSQDTAERQMAVARLADKFRILRNMDLGHLPKGVLYELASGEYSDVVIKAVLVEAESAPIAINRLYEIDEQLKPPPEESKEPEESEDAPALDALSEAEQILDGPPPDLPSIVEPPTPTNFALAQFNRAVVALAEVHTKPLGTFVGTSHTTDGLKMIADFLWAVAAALNDRTLRRTG